MKTHTLTTIRSEFSQSLKKLNTEGLTYLANHSLGLQPDQTPADVLEGLSIWPNFMDKSWESENWMGELSRWRSNIAQLLGLPHGDFIVPKASAGQGLRAVLNSFPPNRPIRILTTTAEFDSADAILKAYQQAGLAEIKWIEPTLTQKRVPHFIAEAILAEIKAGFDLVCLSHVFFQTGQILPEVKNIADTCHQVGAVLLLDVYHSAGCVPVDLLEFDADFAVGGSYKYLRGGPGAGYLALHPRIAAQESQTRDIGWFANANPFSFERSETLTRAPSGAGWMESTFPALLPYQARAGLESVLGLTVPAIRHHSLQIQLAFREAIAGHGVPLFEPNDPTQFGAFSLLVDDRAPRIVNELRNQGVIVDSRGPFLRFSPDVLTDENAIDQAASAFKKAWLSCQS